MQAILHARIEEVSEDTGTSIKQLKDHQMQSERRLDARIEELSRDMTASFKQLADYQIQTERKIDTRFDKIEGDIAAIKEDMVAMEGRLKGDMAAMEGRMLDAFKQVLTVIDLRLPPPQA
jgi:hypothetical protein